MRPGQSNKRGRGRGGRKGPSPLSRSYESNGPDVKIRGTAQHIADKYINLARDAQSSGDTVLSEAYLQHAEHFYRIVAAAQQQMNQPVNVKRADDPIETEESNEREGFDPSDPDAPQPDANANANGSGQSGEDFRRGRDEDDGDRRSRRNRGRQRRGRGDEARGEDYRGQNNQDGSQSDSRAETRGPEAGGPEAGGSEAGGPGANGSDSANGHDGGAQEMDRSGDAPVEQAVTASEGEANGHAEDQGGDTGADEKPRRAPRQRKARVEVADRFDGEDPQASGHVDPEPKSAPEAPKPVTLGDDVPPVQQAAADES